MQEIDLQPPVLLFVAHWDDEILCAGGTLYKYGEGWDVVCCTNKEHLPQESDIYKEVCKEAKANCYTLPIFQRQRRYKGESIKKFFNKAPRTVLTEQGISEGFQKAGIDRLKYKTVLTHHPNGDWGRHRHHSQIGNAAISLFPAANIYQFIIADCISSENVYYYYMKNASHIVLLREEDLLFKNKYIREYKGSPYMYFGILNEEAFILVDK
jgi:hypothetical protein